MESVEHPDGHQLHAGDRVTWTAPMPTDDDGPRVENGQRGQITTLHPSNHAVRVLLDGEQQRHVQLHGPQLGTLRLAYAGHVLREQGATVERAVVVTGGWQTSRESAYVEATRARDQVDWHLAREDLDGTTDTERLDQHMSTSRAQEPSLTLQLADPRRAPGDPHDELHVERLIAPRLVPDLDRDLVPGIER